ncbi:type I methionyl aminopeptidase [Compostibacter hankyongensis]|uniref:Methionine aminopeptidase n=1 Tax=Compostibacter hankyongensis TaxID=1007089 RepID=A0ABP8GAC6_9BACT
MIFYKTEEEIGYIRQSALLVSATLAEVAKFLKAGITTAEVDRYAETFIRDHGAVPSFKDYHGFPATCCISVNETVVHGIPGDYVLKDGDLVSVDCGALMNGFHGDSAYTFGIGAVAPEVLRLMGDTRRALYEGVEKAVAGNRIGDIGFAVQHYTEISRGYGVVREMVGHGLGRELHEEPQVPNYGRRGNGSTLKEGLVICIEPMINLGTRDIYYLDDGWSVVTRDGKPSAHYEHTVVVRKGKAELLSDFSAIEAAEAANEALCSGY